MKALTGCLGSVVGLLLIWAVAIAWGVSIVISGGWTVGDIFWKAVACILLLVAARVVSLIPILALMLIGKSAKS